MNTTRKKIYVAIIVAAVIIGAIVFIYKSRKTDNIDYPFVNDAQALGTWCKIDTINSTDSFQPEKYNANSIYSISYTFAADGEILMSKDGGKTDKKVDWYSWTSGILIHKGDKTASKYVIKTDQNTKFMLLENKNGDYAYANKAPTYLVLRRK